MSRCSAATAASVFSGSLWSAPLANGQYKWMGPGRGRISGASAAVAWAFRVVRRRSTGSEAGVGLRQQLWGSPKWDVRPRSVPEGARSWFGCCVRRVFAQALRKKQLLALYGRSELKLHALIRSPKTRVASKRRLLQDPPSCRREQWRDGPRLPLRSRSVVDTPN